MVAARILPGMRVWGAIVVAVLTLAVAGCSSSASSEGGHGTGNGASKFVQYVRAKADAVANDIGIIQSDIQGVSDSGDTLKLATDAQTMHDNLADWYQDLLLKTDDSDAQIGFAVAVKELRDAAGKVVDWTDSPTSGATARAAAGLRSAVTDWNGAVTTLWGEAGAADPPPTIGS